jgi:hypothetical protein
MTMKKLVISLLAISCTLWLAAGLAMAQSSGSFTYNDNGATEHCVLQSSGTITGGEQCSQSSTCSESGSCTANSMCASNDCDTSTDECVNCTITPGASDCAGSFSAGIKANSGNGNVFVVEPSAVVGLLTDVSLQKNSTLDVGTSSAYAGVDFQVSATAPDGSSATVVPGFPVTYAARYVQISSNLFDMLGTACDTTTGCFFNFNESTVSAHSFQFLIPNLTEGVYGVTANWLASLGNTGISTSLTCVGPVNVTVQQNKVFSFNKPN